MKRLTQELVESIRMEAAAGVRQAAIAKKYGVSPAAVCRILKGNRHAPKQEQIVEETT